MGDNLILRAAMNFNVENHQAFTKLQDTAMPINRSFDRLAHEINVEIRGDRQSLFANMGDGAGIAANIGKREQGGAGDRVTGPQMTLISIEAHAAATIKHIGDEKILIGGIKLREYLGQEQIDLIRIHDRF